MSIGHRLEQDELSDTTLTDLYSTLGDRDTPSLYDTPSTLDTEHDWPAGGGMSLDMRRLYIDRVLYQQCMDGEFKKTGLTPVQQLNGWFVHERSENAIIIGDNPVDNYWPAHNRALAREHEHYRHCGVEPALVEKTTWPALVACYKRPIKNPPLDAWCGVYLDDPDAQDEEIIAQLIRFGVHDARRRDKYSLHYGMGEHTCGSCRNWDAKTLSMQHGDVAACIVISGRVRLNRSCDLWLPDDSDGGLLDSGMKLTPASVDYTEKGKEPELCRRCVHWQGESRCELIRGAIAERGWCRLWCNEPYAATG